MIKIINYDQMTRNCSVFTLISFQMLTQNIYERNPKAKFQSIFILFGPVPNEQTIILGAVVKISSVHTQWDFQKACIAACSATALTSSLFCVCLCFHVSLI